MDPRYHAIGLALILTFAPLVAHADCTVVSSDAEGVPVRITCGGLRMYAVTPAQLARWAEIEDSLTACVADLRTCDGQRHDLSQEQSGYLARDAAWSARVDELTAGVLRLGDEVAARHSTTEVVVWVGGSALLAAILAYVGGYVHGRID